MSTSSSLSHYSKVLRNRNFFLLWIGQIISQLGDRLDQMALIAYVYLRTPGSTVEIAKILSFTIIPVFLVGPVAGAYVDRWDRRKTMYACDLLRALLVLTIPLFLFQSKNLVPVYVIIFLTFCVGRFFVPAKLAIIPDLVEKNDLVMANSLVNITGMIASVIGFGVSGVIVERLGARSGFYLDSLSFVVSGTLIFLISRKVSRRMRLKEVSKEIVQVFSTSGTSVLQEMKEGVLCFVRTKGIRLTAGIIFLLWVALGAIYVVAIVFVQQTLGSATRDLGLLAMFLGIGLFLGSLVYGKFGRQFSHYKTIFVSLVLSGLMLVLFATGLTHYPYFRAAAGLACGLGFFVAPIMIASNTIIHNSSDDCMRGKIFSSLEVIMHLGFLLSMFFSSFLAKHVSHQSILVSVGLLFGFLGLANLLLYKKIKWSD